MEKFFILDFWYGDGYGDIPILLNSRSDAEEMALATHQERLYEDFLHLLLQRNKTIEEAVEWADDDVLEYVIREAVAPF